MLGPRALNRALLARQLLLERRPDDGARRRSSTSSGSRPRRPSRRTSGCGRGSMASRPAELATALTDRTAVRASLMRATVHLVSADDALVLRPLIQPVLERGFDGSAFARGIAGVDRAELLAAGRALLEERPRTSPELGRLLAERWPESDPVALSSALGYLSPLVQVPPAASGAGPAAPARTTMEAWLGRPLEANPSLESLVLRYLAAFGPATVMDVQAWSGLTRLGVVFDGLRPRLETFRDEARARALRPARRAATGAGHPGAGAVPARVRQRPARPRRPLPDHPGRAGRIPLPPGNGAQMGTILLDGVFAGTWRIRRAGDRATLAIRPFEPVRPADEAALADEGARLLAFATDGLDRGRRRRNRACLTRRRLGGAGPPRHRRAVTRGSSTCPRVSRATRRAASRRPSGSRCGAPATAGRSPPCGSWRRSACSSSACRMGGIDAADANGNPNERQLEASEAYDVFNAGGDERPVRAGRRRRRRRARRDGRSGVPGRGRRPRREARRPPARRSTASRRPTLRASWPTRSTAPPEAGLVAPDGSTVRIVGRIDGRRRPGSRRSSRRSCRSSTRPGRRTRTSPIHAISSTFINDDINALISTGLDDSLRADDPADVHHPAVRVRGDRGLGRAARPGDHLAGGRVRDPRASTARSSGRSARTRRSSSC